MGYRDWLWRKVCVGILKGSNRLQSQRPPAERDHVRPILIGERYPGLAGAKVYLSENTPESEKPDLATRIATDIVLWLKKRRSLNLSYGYRQLWNGKPIPYSKDFLSVAGASAPVMPEDLKPGANMLEGFAHRGPYAMYLKPDGDEYVFDFSDFARLQPRAPYVAVGGVARFKPSNATTMKLVSIEFGGKKLVPAKSLEWRLGEMKNKKKKNSNKDKKKKNKNKTKLVPAESKEWQLAEKRIVCALNNYSTFIDHLTRVHLCGAGTWAICTHLAFRASHPLRILMQPFIVETMRVNNANIDGLIESEWSNVPSYTGYPLATLNAIMKNAIDEFDIRWFDAEWRQKTLKQKDGTLFPTMKSTVDVWRIFRKLTKTWCDEYLKKIDPETRKWCKELDARVPNGVTRLLGIEDLDNDLTANHVAHLLAVGMFTSSVWHFTVGKLLRNYELFPGRVPTAITEDGLPTLGIMLEKRNSISIAGVLRYRLIDNTFHFPERPMKKIWREFQNDLKAYEEGLDPALKPYSVVPSALGSSVHA